MTSHLFRLSAAALLVFGLATLISMVSNLGGQAALFAFALMSIVSGIVTIMAGVSLLSDRISLFSTRYLA